MSLSNISDTTLIDDDDTQGFSLSAAQTLDTSPSESITGEYNRLVNMSTRIDATHDMDEKTVQPQPLRVIAQRASRADRLVQKLPPGDSYLKPRSIDSSRRLVVSNASSLSRLGVYRQKVVHMLRKSNLATGENSTDVSNRQGQIIYEEDIYDWVLQPFGLGIRFTKRKPYGNIFPSISTYPIVPDLSDDVNNILDHGSIQEIQTLFHNGDLHPFMRFEYIQGWGLLEVSVRCALSFPRKRWGI